VSIVTNDFNHDALTDLAVANYGGNSMSVLLGNGTGAFQVASNYIGFSNPFNLATADLNGDTHPDLVVPNYGGGNITVLWGTGNGSFNSRSNYATGTSPFSVAVGNLNGDAIPDLAVANYIGHNVSIFIGDGSTFQRTTNVAVGTNPRTVAIAEVNGDAANDLVVLEAGNNTVSVLPGNGDGTFQARQDYAIGSSDPYHFVLADLNTDGRKDIAVAGYGSSLFSIMLNDGNGSYSNLLVHSYPGNAIAVAPGDYNGDGRIDLAFAHYIGNTMSVWLGNGGNVLLENPVGSGLQSGLGRGNLSSAADVDYWIFSGVSRDSAMVVIDIPGNPANSSLTVTLQTMDGTTLANFNADSSGWGQSAAVTLPYTGTYRIRVGSNNDYQSEYHIRMSTLRSPAQFETEVNNAITTADAPVFVLTNSHLQSTLAGYLSYGDGSDFYRLGNLVDGTTIALNLGLPSDSGIAGILEIHNAVGTVVSSSAAGSTGLVFTVAGGQ
jgi:hypothetical protein